MADHGELVAVGSAALAEGRWIDARAAFEESIAREESGAACFGLGTVAWWQGDNDASVDQCTRAYKLFHGSGDIGGAVECAVWLSITYKANFANFTAANGWIARAERLLEGEDLGPLHGWVALTKAYRMTDLTAAAQLTRIALDLARGAGDIDLEVAAISQLGLIKVGQGETADGFALIDEAMVAALAGEASNLGTVVYTCCDMLNACELTSDLERATQWCDVADGFAAKYGCPFLYAECRIYYGSVLAARGRWADAERQLNVGLDVTDRTCPGLHHRAMTRLAVLRIRQGRLEEAGTLLSEVDSAATAEAEVRLAVAALMLARGDGSGAARHLEQHWQDFATHGSHIASAFDLLVDAQVAAGDVSAASESADRLATLVAQLDSHRIRALAPSAHGRVFLARGDTGKALTELGAAARAWSTVGLPFEAARTEFELARVLASGDPPRDRDLAIDRARHALSSFETLGAVLEADRVAAFLRSLGVVARVGAKGVGTLTDREREVLHLVGLGLSNPEIADRLHVSRKTAAHHVSNILTKLNVRNRVEAATLAGDVPRQLKPPTSGDI